MIIIEYKKKKKKKNKKNKKNQKNKKKKKKKKKCLLLVAPFRCIALKKRDICCLYILFVKMLCL